MKALKLLVVAASAVACLTTAAHAQDKFPAKPIEMIVPWGAGGGADLLGRILAKWFETDLKTPVPVINMPGGVHGHPV